MRVSILRFGDLWRDPSAVFEGSVGIKCVFRKVQPALVCISMDLEPLELWPSSRGSGQHKTFGTGWGDKGRYS